MMRIAALAGVVGAIAACTEHVQLAPGQTIPGLASLEVTPGESTLAIDDLDTPKAVAFSATGHFRDGSERDVTDLVAWSTDNIAPGTVDERGGYTTSNRAAGHVRVAATSGAIAGQAELTIVVSATIIDSAFPPLGSIDALFPASAIVVENDAARSPTLAYPSSETMFPQGVAGTLFQHASGDGNDAFRLAFDSDVLHLAIYTGSDRWQADDLAWSLIARSHPGGNVRLVVDAAARAMPGTIYRAPSATLRFGKRDADGALYYFSDTTNGVLRGLPASTTASPVLPPAGDNRCIGCHAVSRDGRTFAFGHGEEKLATFDIVTGESPITVGANVPMGWATFSPDGTKLLVANKGELDLRDAATGAPIGRVGLRMKATHPDWSPDGTQVAVALTSDAMNMELKGGSIARIPYNDGAWGEPVVVVASTGDTDNNYFPKWSPDGRYLAYVHAAEPSREAKSAELRLVDAAGGPPLRLALASHRVGGLDGVPDLASTMPAWAPAMEGTVAWLAFATTRPYGIVRPVIGAPQIWIAAVDLARRDDPSFAAFRFAAQEVSQLSNGPVWTVLPAAPERSP